MSPCVCRLTKIMGSVTWIYRKSATIRVTVSLLYFGYNVIKNLLEGLVPFLKQKALSRQFGVSSFPQIMGLNAVMEEQKKHVFFLLPQMLFHFGKKKISKTLWIDIGPTSLPFWTCYSFVETSKCETHGEILCVLEAALRMRIFQASRWGICLFRSACAH